MASSDSAPARVDNVTDLGQARRARSARKPDSDGKRSKASDKSVSSSVEPANKPGEASKDSTETVKATRPARRKPGNRRFDQVKVDRLKAQIADGTYEIDPVRVADKFIEHERN